MKAIWKFEKLENQSKIEEKVMNAGIMKVEAVVFGMMQAVTINCESILSGLMKRYTNKDYSLY